MIDISVDISMDIHIHGKPGFFSIPGVDALCEKQISFRIRTSLAAPDCRLVEGPNFRKFVASSRIQINITCADLKLAKSSRIA